MATHHYTPKIGTVIHSPVFGGGATIIVVGIVPKRVPIVSRERGHDALVSVRITCDDGRAINRPRRAWSLATWNDELARSTIVSPNAQNQADRPA